MSCSTSEMKFQTGFGKGKLPKGAIHGDLFCDNVLFEGGRVAGIIDFGFAATDFFAYDLAIAVNDWCVARQRRRRARRCAHRTRWSRAYDAVRPLTDEERAQWTALLRAAALRFWLSRLYDLHLPRPGEFTHAHDPAPFERILRERVAAPRGRSSSERRDARWPTSARDIAYTRYDGRRGIALAARKATGCSAGIGCRGSACCSAITSR